MKYRFMRFPQGKQKAVTFSYDDGVKSDIKLAEIFENHNIKATFNIVSQGLAEEKSDWFLTKEEIEKHLLKQGHEIAIHGASHLAPGKLRPIDGIREILKCRETLEKIFGTIIRGMAYPNSGITQMESGRTYSETRSYLKSMDIAYARTLDGDNDLFRLPDDWLAWMPTAHHNNEKIFDYIKKFNGIENNDSVYCDERYPRLFYVWGHSFEFDRNRNWDRIETICSKLGGRSDTWYATNMEIYEYTAAYNALIFSADGTFVHNPTEMELWFEIIEDRIYSIKSGETIHIKEIE